jgi:membrane fusion protein (multidrug efflux system)
MLFRIGSEPIPGHERVGARTRSQLTGTAAILVLFIALIGCQDKQAASSAHTAATAPAVSIIVAEPKAVTLVKELPGRITPMRIAEVRPRVSGIIVKQTFEQGSLVKEGTVLYHIDPKPFEVELDAAKAALARADATLFQANRQEDRLRQLLSGQTTTQAQYDLALAAEKQAEADVAAQKAAVQRAQLNLDFATLRAPITGRIGRALVTEGARHDPAARPDLRRHHQSVGELNRLRRDLASGELARLEDNTANVHLIMDDGSLYPLAGRLLFSDVTADPSTGQVTLRASSRTRTTSCSPACTCGRGSSRASIPTRSRCRSRRSSAPTTAAPRSGSCAPTRP